MSYFVRFKLHIMFWNVMISCATSSALYGIWIIFIQSIHTVYTTHLLGTLEIGWVSDKMFLCHNGCSSHPYFT